jgi:3-methyladenine DNA glycosylase Mpg
MLGKIAAALIGERIGGKNKGAGGAVKGIVVETVAKKLIPTIAAAAILGYAYKKTKDILGREGPSYPSDASPSPPSA